MAKYEIITPAPKGGNAPYSLTGSMLIGGPPPAGAYTGNADGSLVAWWRFNASRSDQIEPDRSDKGNSLSASSLAYFPAFTSTETAAPLVQTGSAYFDSNRPNTTSSDLTFGDGSTDTPFTVSVWVRREPHSGGDKYGTVVHRGKNDNAATDVEYQLVLHHNPTSDPSIVQFKVVDSVATGAGPYLRAQTTLSPVALNAWQHIVAVYDGAGKAAIDAGGDATNCMEIYVNGVKQALDDNSGNASSYVAMGAQDEPLYIGTRYSTNDFQGYIMDTAIWNSALTESDIAALFAARNGPIYYTYRNFDLIGYGERLSPTGSQYQMSLQGIDTQPDDIYFPSLLPRIRQGAPMSLWRQGKKISDKYFDDTLAMNPNPQDMRGVGDVKITQRVNFDWEQLNFGQAPVVQQGESYVETNRFNPVEFIRASEETMWPVNLFNLGSLLDYEFDGVIEPFDIRSELLGIVRSRFEGHAVRGGLTGGASETYFGSKQIVDTWHSRDAKAPFFLDAPLNWDTIPLGAYSNITPEPDAPFVAHTAFDITNAPLLMNNPKIAGGGGGWHYDGTPGGEIKYNLALNPPAYSKEILPIPTTVPIFPGGQITLPWGSDLAAWWPLDTDVSVTGDVPDRSGNGYDGTFVTDGSSTAAEQRPAFSTLAPTSYMPQASYFFDDPDLALGGDTKNQITLDHNWKTTFGGAAAWARPFSISFWFRPLDHSPSSTRVLFHIYNVRAINIDETNERIELQIRNSSTYTSAYSSNNSLPEGKWTHVTCVYTGASALGDGVGTMKIYIDGFEDTAVPASTTDARTVLDYYVAYIGDYPPVDRGLYGNLADYAVWNTALSDPQIQALYFASNGMYRYVLKEDSLITAMKEMNTGSYPTIDTTEERATHGFYFGKNAGSITYGDE